MKLDRVIALRNDRTVYRNGELCIKIYDTDYSKTAVFREALNQARAEEAGVCVPAIKSLEIMDGRWSIVSDYIRGETLDRLMKKHPEKRGYYLSLMTELQISVQDKKSPYLEKMKEALSRRISRAQVSDAVKYDLQTRLESMPRSGGICHGEFEPANIIITPEGRPFIIDWPMAMQGSAAADAAITFLILRMEYDDRTAGEYLTAYCLKSNTERNTVLRWVPIAAAAMSVHASERRRAFLLSCVSTGE